MLDSSVYWSSLEYGSGRADSTKKASSPAGTASAMNLDNLCRTAELYDMGSMIKVDQTHQGFLAQRGIGAGFSSVLFTDCRSADDVRECVRFVRPDTPEDKGLYGAATRRHTYMGYGGTPDYVQALRDIVVAIMIEKKGAVDNLEEILSVPGVDMVQWGSTDYSMSIGRVGEKDHPEVVAARNRVFELATKMGVPPRAEIQRRYLQKVCTQSGGVPSL